jgi:hypothetical protein
MDNKNPVESLPEITRRLAELAEIPETSVAQFCKLLALKIEAAHYSTLYGEPKASDIKHSLNGVANAARKLDKALAVLFGESGSFGKQLAASFLEIALDDGAGEDITAYRRRLATLVDATGKAGGSADDLFPPLRSGRPAHSGDNPFFDRFVKGLFEIARALEGRKWAWSCYQNNYGDHREWKGTLVQAMNLLQPHLPQSGFIPKSQLGYVLERLAERYGADADENRPIH